MKPLTQLVCLLSLLSINFTHSVFAMEDYLPSTKTLQQSGVSVENIQALQTVRQKAKSDAEPLKRQMKEQRRAFMAYLASPEATESQAMVLQQKLQGTANQLSELHLKAWFKMRQYLTPEQLKTLINARQTRLAEGRKLWREQKQRPVNALSETQAR